MTGAEWASLGVCALLMAAAGRVAASGLRLLQRIDAYLPPTGARRGQLKIDRGAASPAALLPPPLADELAARPALFLFVSESCPVCDELAPAIPALARAYPGTRFVLCSRREITGPRVRDAAYLAGVPLFRAFGVGVVPYAVKVEGGMVVEHGLVNTAEHVESVLEATPESIQEEAA